ncbi:NUDIX hydrolase [Clostridium gasigenes]|uniref:NUDIX domain-containing protein n=2 Tax=Clostridium gasigenes TaxID=94869 RepID=A0A1H0RKZ2_9CLOT|nr:NUDIX hydrolase [Clostridium gasigenes]SDP29676.1 NUDIX domain-containing protein [Clostridium gasigenes]
MTDITFKTETVRFVYRVAGIIIHNNKLLVMKDENSPYYYIPGGKVGLQELSTDAIKREIREEINIDVKVKRMLWIVENFFKDDESGENFHEIGFYYLLELNDEKIFEKGNEFIMTEGGTHRLVFYWKPLEEIKDLYVYPLFIKENILKLPNSITHIVENKY